MSWLRRTLITGFFVTVPLVVSVVALVWLVRFADRVTRGLAGAWIGEHVPGFGIIVTVAAVLVAGAVANNVLGRRLLQRGESLLLHVPLFRTIYAPVKQLVNAFSPENEAGFKRVVLVDDPTRGSVLGFLTKEFTVDRGEGAGPEPMLAVYVPTNHLYLGDIVLCRPEQARFPEISVEEGVRVFLTGGMGLPPHISARPRQD